MAETVNLLEDSSLAHLLRTASGMVGAVVKSPLAQVTLTINGMELPLTAAFKVFEAESHDAMAVLVEQRAADLVTEAGLEEALHKLRSARLDVMRAFVTLRKRAPSTADQAEVV